VGGGLIRGGIFIQHGPPIAMSDWRYLVVVIIGCIVAAVSASMMAMRFVSVNVICRQVVLPPNCWKPAPQMGMNSRVP
jgi:uncharacterized membrane protein YeiH